MIFHWRLFSEFHYHYGSGVDLSLLEQIDVTVHFVHELGTTG